MKEIKLEVQTRTEKDLQNKKLRETGFLPAVMYGPNTKNLNLKVKTSDLNKVYAVAGKSNLIDIVIDGKTTEKVIIKEAQKDGIKGNIFHVDFFKMNTDKKITVTIPLNFIGESKAVKELGGTLLKGMESLSVKCFPNDLIEKIDVDLSTLNTFSDTIRVSDLNLPENYEPCGNTNNSVANVSAPRISGKAKGTEETKEEEK